KRWNAPIIVDKVLEYIPELENEIEQLIFKKNNMLSVVENMQSLVKEKSTHSEVVSLTVSANEVQKGELILQICRGRDGENVFSNLLQKIEDEGMSLLSASTLHVCDERDCYHIHIQPNFGGRAELSPGNGPARITSSILIYTNRAFPRIYVKAVED
ncbi:Achaete-scute transcription factor-related, partial [Trema orientale]